MHEKPPVIDQRIVEFDGPVIEVETSADRGGLSVARPIGALRRLIQATIGGPDGEESRSRLRLPSPPSYGLTFLLFVVLPSFAYVLYLFGFATDQFAAEARFAIRNSQTLSTIDADSVSSTSDGGSSLASLSLAGQDAFVVASYIRSAAIFADLDPAIDPVTIYSRPEADYFSRLTPDASREKLVEYWRNMVGTYVDGPSGMVTVTVRAFRPSDASTLLQAIIDASERLVNTMTQRARDDAMTAAEAELRRAELKLRDALDEMRVYRDKVGFISPESAAESTAALLLQAMTEKMQLDNDYFVSLRAMSANAPTVLAQKSRLDALDQQIDQLKAKLTGPDGQKDTTIATSLVRYEELELKRTFAEKLNELAARALERARQRAEQQSVYLSVFVPPMIPEESRYPRRVAQSLLVPLALLVVWGILALIVATVEDHKF